MGNRAVISIVVRFFFLLFVFIEHQRELLSALSVRLLEAGPYIKGNPLRLPEVPFFLREIVEKLPLAATQSWNATQIPISAKIFIFVYYMQ